MFVLFDIDGTLINTGGAGGRSLLGAFSDEFDIPDPCRVEFSGRTDRGIASDLFQRHQIEDSFANWLRLRDAYLTRLPRELPQSPGQVLPGVAGLLERLRPIAHVAVGLLTGNIREGARIKLGHFGLDTFFPFGGFGDDHHDRDLVAREALDAGRRHAGPRAPRDVWVLGDTPLDVRCARAIGARVLAVATGTHPYEELADTQPDAVMHDLSNVADVMRTLVNDVGE